MKFIQIIFLFIFSSFFINNSFASSWNFQEWVKIMWNNNINISNSYKLSMRNVVKQNTQVLIKWMKSGQIVNRVKYLSWWNFDVSQDTNLSKYDTLVIKNWNVIISSDLRTSWKMMQITSLRTDNSNLNLWNIYVTPNVSIINSSLYADWWLISIKTSSDFSSLKTYDIQRKIILDKQLIIKWSLFTRNSMWWAILKNWKYTLPEWSFTTDFDLSMYQDIYYTRISKRQSSCENLPANASWNSVSNILQRSWDRIEWFPSLIWVYDTTTSTTNCNFVCNTWFYWTWNICKKKEWIWQLTVYLVSWFWSSLKETLYTTYNIPKWSNPTSGIHISDETYPLCSGNYFTVDPDNWNLLWYRDWHYSWCPWNNMFWWWVYIWIWASKIVRKVCYWKWCPIISNSLTYKFINTSYQDNK